MISLLGNEIDGSSLPSACIAIAGVAEDKMGGTSGGLYSIFFSALAQGLNLPSSSWSSALQHALTKLYTYTRARPPSRTLVDPLDAFVASLSQSSAVDYRAAVARAEEATLATKGMQAKAGRAVYSGTEGDADAEEMDPGAWGVVVLLQALVGK